MVTRKIRVSGTFSQLQAYMSMELMNITGEDLGERLLARCARMSTEALLSGLDRFSTREFRSLAATIAVLAELDQRKACDETAYPSLFRYCTKVLGYSEDQACMRIKVARKAREFPSILRMIATRSSGITALSRLAPHLDSANHRGVLAMAAGKSLYEIDRIVAGLAPEPERRAVIRAISTGSNQAPPAPDDASQTALFESGAGPTSAPASQAAEEVPAGRVLFNFVGDEPMRAKFNRARDLLRHKFPWGRPEQIFDYALEALLDRKDPERRIARIEKRRAARQRLTG